MKWLYRVPIKYQLLLLVLIAVLPALAISVFSGFERRGLALAGAEAECSNHASRLAAEIDTLSRSCDLMLQTLINFPEIQERHAEGCNAVFSKILANNPFFVSFVAALPDGTLFAAGVPLTNAISIADRGYFRDAVRTGRFSAGEYAISRTMGRPIFSFARPVYDAEGKLASVLHVGVALSYIEQLARGIALPKGTAFTVIDRNGLILTETCAGGKKAGLRDDPDLFKRTRAGDGANVFSAVHRNEEMLFACEPLRLYGAGDPYMYVRVEIPKAVVLEPMSHITRRNLSLMLGTALLAMGVAWFIGDRVVGDRIRQLGAYARELTAQHDSVPQPPLIHGGELGDLAEILADMSRSLASTLESLRESETHFRSLFRAVNDAVFVHEAREDGSVGRFLEVNEVACARLGYTREELLQMTPLDIDDPESGIDIRPYGLRIAAGESVTFEQTHLTKDRRRIPVEIRAQSFELKGRKVVLSLARDITERKQAETERLRMERQLQQTQKLESLGVLAGGIAHDFNNLLVGILGNAELALMDLPADSPVRLNLDDITAVAGRAAELCRQLLAYSGKGRFVIGNLDVSEVVRHMTEMLRIAVSRSITMRYDLAENLPAIEGDTTQIRQVIMNLVMNASEAIGPRNGTIHLTTGVTKCDAEYGKTLLPGAVEPGSYVFVEVSDTGCGMDRATQQRIFEPFFTTKFAGRGLGLAAVLGIVRGHHGGAKVYSEVGRGTSVKVFFPATEGVAAPVATAEPAVPEWKGSGTVLVVDDEETVLSTATKILRRAGFSVMCARDGDEAVVLFRSHAAEISCVLLDLTMPRMNGEAAFRELRRIRDDVPVVLSSGYNEQEAIRRFAGRRLTAFIQKPYTTAGLLSCLKGVLATRTDDAGADAGREHG